MFEDKALNKSSVKTYEFDTQRKRKRILHHDEEPDEILDVTGSDHFKRNTFLVIIDQLRCELIKRQIAYAQFDQPFTAKSKINQLTTVQLEEEGKILLSRYPNDLEDSLLGKLLHFKRHINVDKDNLIPKTPLQLCKWMYEKNLRDLYPNIDVALRMYVCIPIANCTAERSFSFLRRIKNYLRSTMLEDRLNALAVLCIELDILNSLDFNDIINDFAKEKSRRKVV